MITGSDVVVLAVPFSEITSVVTAHRPQFAGKVVIDPSNAVDLTEDGTLKPLLDKGQTAGAVVAGLLPSTGRYAKAFGTLGADSLRDGARRQPAPVVLCPAADDAVTATEQVIRSAGFEPVLIGGTSEISRVEMGRDLHQYGGLQGRLLDGAEAKSLVNAS